MASSDTQPLIPSSLSSRRRYFTRNNSLPTIPEQAGSICLSNQRHHSHQPTASSSRSPSNSLRSSPIRQTHQVAPSSTITLHSYRTPHSPCTPHSPRTPQSPRALSPRTSLRLSPQRRLVRSQSLTVSRNSSTYRSACTCSSSHVFGDFHPSALVRQSSPRYSPRPSTVWAFCQNELPLAIFTRATTAREIGSLFRALPDIWEPIIQKEPDNPQFAVRQLIQLTDEQFYDWFHDLTLKSEPTRHYAFKELTLCELAENDDDSTDSNSGTNSSDESHWTVLMKDGEVQEVIPLSDQARLAKHFRRSFVHYLPIYRWFQEQDGFPDFRLQPGEKATLRDLVTQMPDRRLLKYLKHSEAPDSPGGGSTNTPEKHVRFYACPIY